MIDRRTFIFSIFGATVCSGLPDAKPPRIMTVRNKNGDVLGMYQGKPFTPQERLQELRGFASHTPFNLAEEAAKGFMRIVQQNWNNAIKTAGGTDG